MILARSLTLSILANCVHVIKNLIELEFAKVNKEEDLRRPHPMPNSDENKM